MKLSQRIYACAEKIWPQYLSHPFVVQMADGTLPEEKFRYYMLQDYLYLRDYVKIFAAIIQKADDFEQIRFLRRIARTCRICGVSVSRMRRSTPRARTSTTAPTRTI